MNITAPDDFRPGDTAWRTLQQQLLRYARSRVRNRTLAEDAVSEAMITALQTRMRFESAGHQRAWLMGVLKHKLADEMRRESRWVSIEPADGSDGAEGTPSPEAGAHYDPASHFAGQDLRNALERRCLRLPATQRTAFTLRELAGLETEEVCERMGITRNHFWVLMHRARRTLQKQLHEYR